MTGSYGCYVVSVTLFYLKFNSLRTADETSSSKEKGKCLTSKKDADLTIKKERGKLWYLYFRGCTQKTGSKKILAEQNCCLLLFIKKIHLLRICEG